MKTLNNYINESLLDDEEDLLKADVVEIEKFIKHNYRLRNCKLSINGSVVNVVGQGTINLINKKLTKLTDFNFVFGEVEGDFLCSRSNIDTLIGAPRKVRGFECKMCDNLKDLQGAPKEAEYFQCGFCDELETLKGAPNKVDEFSCSFCEKLKNLNGLPDKMKGSLYCGYCDSLKDLSGAPSELNFLDCSYCKNLINLKGAPEKAQYINCVGCPKLKIDEKLNYKVYTGMDDYMKESLLDDESDLLNDDSVMINKFIKDNYRHTIIYTIRKEHNKNIVDVNSNAYMENSKESSLTGGLFEFGKVNGSFNINNCPNIENLIGSPKEVDGGMSVINCKNLKTFKGSPEKVAGTLFCSNCDKLTSLEGTPKEIGGDLNCASCKNIKSIKGLPEKIEKYIYLYTDNLSEQDKKKIERLNYKNILKFRKYRY